MVSTSRNGLNRETTTAISPVKPENMESKFNKELELSLAKEIDACKFRELLVKFGIASEREYVKVNLQKDREILASCEVLPASSRESFQSATMPFNAFRDAIEDEFLASIEALFDLTQKSPLQQVSSDSRQPENEISETFVLSVEVGDPVQFSFKQRYACGMGIKCPQKRRCCNINSIKN